jgi:hypothetical protein
MFKKLDNPATSINFNARAIIERMVSLLRLIASLLCADTKTPNPIESI